MAVASRSALTERERTGSDRMSLPFLPQKNPEFSFLLSFCAFTCNRRRGSRLTGRTTVCLGSKEALTAFDVIFIHLFCGYYCGRSFPQKTTLRTASPPLNCQITTAPVGSVETKRSCVKHCCKTSRHQSDQTRNRSWMNSRIFRQD